MDVKFNNLLKEQLNASEALRETEIFQPERTVIQAMIAARQQTGITQKELSKRTGIAQGDISKLETGNVNPSIRTLWRFVESMGMVLKVEFLPQKSWIK